MALHLELALNIDKQIRRSKDFQAKATDKCLGL